MKMMHHSTAKKLARAIAKNLLSMDYGTRHEVTGDRLAIMKTELGREKELGGRCKESVESTIYKHLIGATKGARK